MGDNKTQLTSVKVSTELFEDFRVLSIRTKVNFQKLVDRTLHLYITDEQYRKTINNHLDTFYTGSTL
jgi:hypothetical protein